MTAFTNCCCRAFVEFIPNMVNDVTSVILCGVGFGMTVSDSCISVPANFFRCILILLKFNYFRNSNVYRSSINMKSKLPHLSLVHSIFYYKCKLLSPVDIWLIHRKVAYLSKKIKNEGYENVSRSRFSHKKYSTRITRFISIRVNCARKRDRYIK